MLSGAVMLVLLAAHVPAGAPQGFRVHPWPLAALRETGQSQAHVQQVGLGERGAVIQEGSEVEGFFGGRSVGVRSGGMGLRYNG